MHRRVAAIVGAGAIALATLGLLGLTSWANDETGQPAGVTGLYSVRMNPLDPDPGGFYESIAMPETLGLQIALNPPFGIQIAGPAPWVSVFGPIPSGTKVSATGKGTVAGYANIQVSFQGTAEGDQLTGLYTVGVEGGLPGGKPLTYGVKPNVLIPSPTPTATPTPGKTKLQFEFTNPGPGAARGLQVLLAGTGGSLNNPSIVFEASECTTAPEIAVLGGNELIFDWGEKCMEPGALVIISVLSDEPEAFVASSAWFNEPTPTATPGPKTKFEFTFTNPGPGAANWLSALFSGSVNSVTIIEEPPECTTGPSIVVIGGSEVRIIWSEKCVPEGASVTISVRSEDSGLTDLVDEWLNAVTPTPTATMNPEFAEKIDVCIDARRINSTDTNLWTKAQIDALVEGADAIWRQANINITWNNSITAFDDPNPPPNGPGSLGDIRESSDVNTDVLLTDDVDATQTSLPIIEPGPFKVNHQIVIDDEHMTIVAVADEKITVVRGQKETTAAAHSIGTDIFLQGSISERLHFFDIPDTSGKGDCVPVFFIDKFVDNLGQQTGSVLAFVSGGSGPGAHMAFSSKAKGNSQTFAHELGHVFGLDHVETPHNLMRSDKLIIGGEVIEQTELDKESQMRPARDIARSIRDQLEPTPTLTPTVTPVLRALGVEKRMPLFRRDDRVNIAPLSGWEIKVFAGDGCQGTPIASGPTTPGGLYTSPPLPIGPYSVAETLQPGWERLVPFCIDVILGPAVPVTAHATFWNWPVRNGDINKDGVTDSRDGLLVLQTVAGFLDWDDLADQWGLANSRRVDVNEDGRLDARDVALILQFGAGLLDSLPATGG